MKLSRDCYEQKNQIPIVSIGKQLLLWAAVIFLSSLPAPSQERSRQDDQEKSPIRIQRLKDAVTFDGESREKAWENIKPLPMVMQTPNFGQEPSERTEVLIAFDDDYLYIAGRMFDKEPDKIQAPSKKRDYMQANTEWFGILLDTFCDKENALSFYTTPSGLRFDAEVFNDGEPRGPGHVPINFNWNTFWDVRTIINTEGWFLEMRIPFSSLRFQEKDGRVTMGLIAIRFIPRKNEFVVFPAIYPKWGGYSNWKCSQARTIELAGVKSKRPVYVTPYGLTGYGQQNELNEPETAYVHSNSPTFEAGLDVKYSLTSNLTLDLTLNTDFAQVEADDQQVNLTRFSLFFPEKRQFFQERSGIFDFSFGGPTRLFYSRNIGLYEEEVVRIYGGARLVGRLGSWDIGFLDMQTAAVKDLSSENFGVFRIRRQVLNPYSYVGGILTTRIGSDGSYNVVYGLDSIIRASENDYFLINMGQCFEDGTPNNPLSLDLSRFRLSWERRTIKGVGAMLNVIRRGHDFNPGIGFEVLENYQGFGGRFTYGWMPGEASPLQSHYLYNQGHLLLHNEDNSLMSGEFGPGWGFASRSGAVGEFGLVFNHENLLEPLEFTDDTEIPVGSYNFFGFKGMYQTPGGKLLSANFTLEAGGLYDGNRISVKTSPTWALAPDISLSGVYEFNYADFKDRNQRFIAHIMRLRLQATFTTAFSAAAFVQYNSAVGAVIANVRLRLNPQEGNDLYLVFNESFNTDRTRETPHLPPYNHRTVLLKYSYTFQF